MPQARRLIWPLLFFLFLTCLLTLLAAAGSPAAWSGWRPATCLPDACFCEASRSEFVRQPIDTWSNLAFVLAGLLMLTDDLRPAPTRSNLLARRRTYGVLYALAVILIGLGSWFYHASLTFAGQWFDVMGMYLLGTFMVLYGVARWSSMSGRRFAAVYVAVNCVLALGLIAVPELRRYLFGLLLLAAIVFEVLAWRRRGSVSHPGKVRYFAAALLAYLLAQFIWMLDLSHIVCDPYGLLQGHALWHVLGAASAGLIYLYYRSEFADLSGGASSTQ